MISCMEEKMFDAQDDAHLSDVLSYPVHLHVIHAARRRLASKREWKITRIEQKKKTLSTPGPALIFLAQHVTLCPHVYVAQDHHSYPFCKISFNWKK